uniref:Translation initiation factor IF-2, chloroplastic n=1 Tax=Alsidium seaforthii TaxID=2007182 RepID=A0A1Z1MDA3_9FLOR|nr:translation initiation factor 2 [Bryothamnion seaforthii]ARW63946.1 translation initiation factor 2 [Bryothamnion seaforthii]
MINIFSENFLFMQLFCKSICIYTSLSSVEYFEDVLKLNSPMLVYDLNPNFINSSGLLEVSNPIVNKTSSPTKFDKKYREDNYVQDTLEIKRNKSKSIKKKRNNSSGIDKEDIFVDTKSDFFSQEDLNFSLTKSRKPTNKNKKRDKSKSNIIPNNNLDKIQNNPNLASNVNKSSKSIVLNSSLTVQELSVMLNIPEAEIITFLFLKKSICATVNQMLDVSIAKEVALNYDFDLLDSDIDNQNNKIQPKKVIYSSLEVQRAPIITILGHVDHGKTSLLDAILETNLAQKEYGGITQSIAGYQVKWNCNSKTYDLIFVDTPGHESFKSMRLRGAKITDIALLVIAADDGLKPQTIEAIRYIQDMNLNCIIVLTKIDKEDTNRKINRIKEELSTYNLVLQEFGGHTALVSVSAKTSKNIDLLLSSICSLCDKGNFVANPDQMATGTILESYLDKKQGPVANIIVQNGTLKLGDIIISDYIYGKVKNITSLSNKKQKSSGPSSIVQILGFSIIPQAGSLFQVVSSEKEAKQISINYSNNQYTNLNLKSLNTRITSNNLSTLKQLKLIIKAETQGGLEAIIDLLSNISQNKVQLNIVSISVGSISNTDIELAITTASLIICFNVYPSLQVNNSLKKHKIICQTFNIIYDLLDYIKDSMLNLIEPEYEKNFIGRAVVQTVFKMNKGFVAGCIVNEGKLKRNSHICVYSNNQIVYEGMLISLKRVKNDVDEVSAVSECGLMANYDLWQQSDIIDAYELLAKDKALD